MPQNNSIESLYKRYLANDLDEEELADFLQRLHDPANEAIVSQFMEGTWKEMYEIKEPGVVSDRPQADVVPMYRRKAFKWVAAACIILLLGITTYTVISKRSEKSPATEVAKTNDVQAPSNTRAVITLADGTKVYLDSVNNGTIAQENNVAVVKNSDGSIIYSHEGTKEQSQIAYNTLFNPRGSKVISLTLSDGTKVWLNSESSLKYPIAFNSNSREVEITGEAYFEVQHNAKQPFKVHLPNGSVVEDLGTAFNINAYTDEQEIKTTLVEGSLRVFASSVSSAVKLVPGEQSVINRLSPNYQITRSPDIDEVLAWKNGLFSFEKTDIGKIMNDIARWYDVQVEYEGAKPQITLSGTVKRNLNVSKVLQMLELSGLKFRIEGKKIIVLK